MDFQLQKIKQFYYENSPTLIENVEFSVGLG